MKVCKELRELCSCNAVFNCGLSSDSGDFDDLDESMNRLAQNSRSAEAKGKEEPSNALKVSLVSSIICRNEERQIVRTRI